MKNELKINLKMLKNKVCIILWVGWEFIYFFYICNDKTIADGFLYNGQPFTQKYIILY